ncbi:MAG TPA: hypothetical protein PK413_12385 [Thermoanaerobaculia bacterium]|nr:hypothetical protein [Thermoanaerobaculia bacterium]
MNKLLPVLALAFLASVSAFAESFVPASCEARQSPVAAREISSPLDLSPATQWQPRLADPGCYTTCIRNRACRANYNACVAACPSGDTACSDACTAEYVDCLDVCRELCQ